jgi:cell division protein DivIC
VKVIQSEKPKPKKSILLRLAIFAFAAYTVVALVNQQVQIADKRKQLDSVKQQIRIQEIKNDDIKNALSTGEGKNSDYIERAAREGLNFAKPGERVFVNIAGK